MDPYGEILRRLAALERRMSAVYRTGRVAAVETDPYRVRVDLGTPGDPVVTPPLPVFVGRAGAVRVWSPLTVGERVAVLSPGGEDAVAHVLPGLISEDHPAPADGAAEEVVSWRSPDGRSEVGRLRIARGATGAATTAVLTIGAASITLSGGDVTLDAPGTIYMRSPRVRGIAARG